MISYDKEATKKITNRNKAIETEYCNRLIVMIPINKVKEPLDVLKDLEEKNEDGNALLNVKIESKAFLLPPFYMSFCHKVAGTSANL